MHSLLGITNANYLSVQVIACSYHLCPATPCWQSWAATGGCGTIIPIPSPPLEVDFPHGGFGSGHFFFESPGPLGPGKILFFRKLFEENPEGQFWMLWTFERDKIISINSPLREPLKQNEELDWCIRWIKQQESVNVVRGEPELNKPESYMKKNNIKKKHIFGHSYLLSYYYRDISLLQFICETWKYFYYYQVMSCDDRPRCGFWSIVTNSSCPKYPMNQ